MMGTLGYYMYGTGVKDVVRTSANMCWAGRRLCARLSPDLAPCDSSLRKRIRGGAHVTSPLIHPVPDWSSQVTFNLPPGLLALLCASLILISPVRPS